MSSEIITALACTVPTGISLFLLWRYVQLQKRFSQLTSGITDKNLVEVVKDYVRVLDDFKNTVSDIKAEFTTVRKENTEFLRKVAVARYQGFKDTGGDQSFSLAILDSTNTGIVFTSLQGRDVSKVYAKKIENGTSAHALTDEEKNLLTQAIQK